MADFQNVYAYDALNRLTQLYQQGQTGGNAVAVKGANLTYNLLGQLATIARTNFFGVGPAPDIATGTFSYDNANRLTSISYTHNGGTATDAYSWIYDNANRVATMTTTTDGTATYSYDNTDQVTGTTYTTNPGATQPANETYSFDANGNRTNTGYSTGTNNQLSSDGTFNYTYDGEGNRATRTRISNASANDYKTTYTWDYRNRLTDVQFYNNSNVLTKHVHYTYDVFDHLIGKQVDDTGGGNYDRAEFYVLDGTDVVLQLNGSGALTERYINGPSVSGADTVLAEEDVTSLTSPGTVTWPLTDNLGTVRDIVDSIGAVIDHLVYNSFGQVAFETATSVHHLQGYTGGITDSDTGMVSDWHRWFDPATGRWISEDPIGFAGGDVNTWRYISNSTLNDVDTNGLFRSGVHRDITKRGASKSTAQIKNDPVLELIINSNIQTDNDKLTSAEYHAQVEDFPGTLRSLMTQIKNTKGCTDRLSFNTLIYNVGHALHILQDFYSHTDWVEGSNMVPLYKIYIYEGMGTEGEKELVQKGKNNIPHNGTLDLNAIFSGDDSQLDNVIYYEGGYKPTGTGSQHNRYAADDAGLGRSSLTKGHYVSGSFPRTKRVAIQQTTEFLQWVYDNLEPDVRKCLFKETPSTR